MRKLTPPRTLALLFVLGLAAALLSLLLGSSRTSPAALLSALAAGESDPIYRILVYVRLPRTLAAALAGAALGLSGVLIQAVLNNAMASPNVIGVNAGAGFCVLLTVVLFPSLPGLLPAASFGGALATALLIYALAARAGLSRTTLILAGVTISSMLTAGANTLTLLFPNASVRESAFMLGGFSGVAMRSVLGALPYLLAGFLLAAFLAVDLDILQLGEETAASLGLSVARVRFLAILAAALLAGAAVSFAGLLGFVGLLAPHMARRLVGSGHRLLMPATILFSADLVLLCDVLARVLFAPFELPVGILLSLLGGPFLLGLLLRRKRSRIHE